MRPQNPGNQLQESGHDNDMVEDVTLVHQVGQPAAAGFLLELRAGALAFLNKQLLYPLPQAGEEFWSHEVFEDDEAVLEEVVFFDFGKTHERLLPRRAMKRNILVKGHEASTRTLRL